MNITLKSAWQGLRSLVATNVGNEFINIKQWWNDHDNGSRYWTNTNAQGFTILGAQPAALPNAQQANSTFNVWVDESGNNLKFQVKYSNGTVKVGTVALI